jgi:hypothetical protein
MLFHGAGFKTIDAAADRCGAVEFFSSSKFPGKGVQ